MQATPPEIDNALHLLTATPQHFATLCGSLPHKKLQHKPDAHTWSANEILAHLRACADVWGETIEAMLTQDKPTLRHISPRTYLRKTNYPQQDFHQSLQAFTEQRRQLLARLQPLETADWSRSAIIKERSHTVFSQSRRMALHEAAHCEQLEALVSQLLA